MPGLWPRLQSVGISSRRNGCCADTSLSSCQVDGGRCVVAPAQPPRRPPPPAPPDVPALEDAAKGFGGREPKLSEMLAVHRENKLCNSCHERMDPLGLAFENFTALGTWRETEAGQTIEVAGRLVTGERFASVSELKRILTHERRFDYYRCLTEKLLTYALGRGLTYRDIDTVDRIVDALEREGGRMSVLVNGVINSVPFQTLRRGHPALTSISSPSSPFPAKPSP